MCRLGTKLLELESLKRRRARGRIGEASLSPEEVEEELVVVEREFCAVVPRPRVRFECSMVQAPVENSEGTVSWRDVTCEDADDFDALCSGRWLVTDFVEEGEGVSALLEAGKLGDARGYVRGSEARSGWGRHRVCWEAC